MGSLFKMVSVHVGGTGIRMFLFKNLSDSSTWGGRPFFSNLVKTKESSLCLLGQKAALTLPSIISFENFHAVLATPWYAPLKGEACRFFLSCLSPPEKFSYEQSAICR